MDEILRVIEETKSLDLVYGFPDTYEVSLPTYMKEYLERFVKESSCSHHQYSEGRGNGRLTKILSTIYSEKLQRKIDDSTEILITNGALSALYSFTISILEPDDEVIIFEPFFYHLRRHVVLAKAKPIVVPLKVTQDGNWYIDIEELDSKFTEKTRLMILNNPHNPTGKMFTEVELKQLARLCIKHSIYCLSDEVYDFLTINDGKRPRHVHIASMPGMWCRTMTVSSGGKAFGITGWRIGWACGPANLIDKVNGRHATIIDSCPSIFQQVIAAGLETEFPLIGTKEDRWSVINEKITQNCSRLRNAMESVGMRPLKPDFGYYLLVDIREFAKNIDLSGETGRLDERVCKWLCRNIGVGTIPGSCVYYCEENRDSNANYLRFCAIKSTKLIEEVEKRIISLKEIIKKEN